MFQKGDERQPDESDIERPKTQQAKSKGRSAAPSLLDRDPKAAYVHDPCVKFGTDVQNSEPRVSGGTAFWQNGACRFDGYMPRGL
jgi:hypothetical protein